MCLRTVDKTPVKHDYGYKVVLECAPNVFKSEFVHTPLMLGETYQSKSTKIRSTHDRTVYVAGFHYFLKYKQAKDYVLNSFNSQLCILRIKVEDIFATGIDNSCNCTAGVAKFITPTSLMYRKSRAPSSQRKQAINIVKKDELISFIMKNINDEKNYNKIIDKITESYENFKKFTVFSDANNRFSDMFKKLTKIWVWTLKNRAPDVMSFYRKMRDETSKNENKLYLVDDKIFNKCIAAYKKIYG